LLFSLDDSRPGEPFPDPSLAETDPDGLLAVGGDLAPERIVQAYRQGIFPWYGEDQPILWWSPDPRMVLFPDDLHVSRSLAKELRRKRFRVTFDLAFDRVIEACAQPRKDEPGTWLMPEMIVAYRALHQLGRRWVVLVPAGFVLHDHLALAEPTLVQRSGMVSVGPARSDTDALDLSQGAPGLAIELRCTGPHDLLPATRRGVTEAIAVDAFLCTPARPDALLAEAARRNLPVG